LSPITWLGKESGAGHIPLPEATLAAVVDHATSFMLATSDRYLLPDGFLLRFFQEYFRVLAPGGVAYVAFNRFGYQSFFGHCQTGKKNVSPILESLLYAGFPESGITLYSDITERYTLSLPGHKTLERLIQSDTLTLDDIRRLRSFINHTQVNSTNVRSNALYAENVVVKDVFSPCTDVIVARK
jgi:SAM-dependent methyltransferase